MFKKENKVKSLRRVRLQARILEWVTISFSRGSSWPKDQTQVSCIGGRHFNLWAAREAPKLHSTMSHRDTSSPELSTCCTLELDEWVISSCEIVLIGPTLQLWKLRLQEGSDLFKFIQLPSGKAGMWLVWLLIPWSLPSNQEMKNANNNKINLYVRNHIPKTWLLILLTIGLPRWCSGKESA